MSRRRRAAPLLALVVLVALLLAGCGAEGTGDKGYVDGGGTVTEFPLGERQSVGEVSGTTADGERVSLSELAKGRPTVVNVWAHWCGPCRTESPDLEAAAKQLGDQAAFMGISVRSASKDNVLAFERTNDVGYPSIYDPEARTLLQFPSGVAAQAMPSTVVLDSKGRVSASILGPVPSTRTIVELVESADSGRPS